MQIILSFLVMILNIIAGILPVVLIIILFLYDGIQIAQIDSLIFGIKAFLFCISFALCLYIILDALLGFAVFFKTKKLQEYQNSMTYGKLCQQPFEEMQKIFAIPETKLLISPDARAKTYTVASVGKSFICITTGTLHSLRTNTQSDEEFQELLLALFARQFVIISSGGSLVRTIFEINASILKITKRINALFFSFCGNFFSIIPVIGTKLQTISRFFSKNIMLFLEVVNFFLTMACKIFTNITIGSNEYYYDAKTSEIVGGESVAKALYFTVKPDHKFFSTSTNIYKRIKKISAIQKKEKIFLNGLIQKAMEFLSVMVLFCLIILFAYQIKIWRIFYFI